MEVARRLKATGKRVLILVGGEFGRKPRDVIVPVPRDGRDHWSDGFSWAVLSINQPKFKTTATGDTGPDGILQGGDLVDPVRPRDVGAMLYHVLGYPVGEDAELDLPLTVRAAPAVDRMNDGEKLLKVFGLA